jgi:hypothetical protein
MMPSVPTPAGAHAQHLGVLQSLLTGHPNVRDDQVTAIPANLVDRQVLGWLDQRRQAHDFSSLTNEQEIA